MNWAQGKRDSACFGSGRFLIVVLLAASCTSDLPNGGGDATAKKFASIVITPSTAALSVTVAGGQQQQFTAAGVLTGGKQEPLTGVVWSLDSPHLGSIDAKGMFSAAGGGGTVKVMATFQGLGASAALIVKLEDTVLDTGVTAADSKHLARTPTTDATRAPKAIYPEHDTMIPANLPPMLVQWKQGDSSNALFGLRITGSNLDLLVATTKLQWQPAAALWSSLLATARGKALSITVLGTSGASTAKPLAATPLRLNVAASAASGTIYYWATGAASSLKNGIMKIQAGTATVSDYYTQTSNGTMRCSGCHAVSRDGSKMVFTEYPLDSSYTNYAKGLDIKTKKPFVPVDKHLGNFFAFSRAGDLIVAAEDGEMNLHKATDGALVSKLSGWGGSKVTHPDWSPVADKLAFVIYPATYAGVAENFCSGSVAVADISPTGGVLTPKVLVKGSGTTINNYYPAFSPDGNHLVFNQAGADNNDKLGDYDCDAYANPGANLYVIPVTGGAPVPLARANGAGIGLSKVTNSWPKWAPSSAGKVPDVYWVAFSSTRDYGRVLINSTRQDIKHGKSPQLWISAVRTSQLTSGKDPSYPAFWLPGQKTDSGNHIPFWTRTLQ